MVASDRYEDAARFAERFISERTITTLPIDPVNIAEQLGILVYPKPARTEGASGMLLRLGEEYAIAYATYIDSPGFQRFSIAHELGHYLYLDISRRYWTTTAFMSPLQAFAQIMNTRRRRTILPLVC